MRVFVAYRTAFEEAEQDKNGVVVSHDENGIDFGIVEPSVAENGVNTFLEVKNDVPASQITIIELKVDSVCDRAPTLYVTPY